MKLVLLKCHRTSLIASQHWFRNGLITSDNNTSHYLSQWLNVDPVLCHRMASQGYIELNRIFWLGFRLAVLPTTQNRGLKILFNSLCPERSIYTFENVIFNHVWLIVICTFSHDNAFRWKPQELTNEKSTLVQVMAWCRQATSHYLSQYWPRFVSPYGVTRPQCVLTNMDSNMELSWQCILRCKLWEIYCVYFIEIAHFIVTLRCIKQWECVHAILYVTGFITFFAISL